MTTINHLDYSHFDGGLVRMMNRFNEECTLTGDFDADEQIRASGNVALLGLLYDQRVRAESAFTGPLRLQERLGHLDMQKIADADPEEFRELFGQSPAVHRFTNKLAETKQKGARIIAEEYGGDATHLWHAGADSPTIQNRLGKRPGCGTLKAMKMEFVLHYFGFRDFSDEADV